MAKAAPVDPELLVKKQAHISVERYFETSLLLMLATGFVTVVTTGKLDIPSVVVVSIAFAVRLYGQLRERNYSISPKTVTRLSIFYIFFFALDFLIFSPGPSLMDNMLSATVHLVFFTAVIKVFTARTYRDFAYLATLSFLMMLASAILTVGTVYVVCFTFYVLFAISTLISYEIKRSTELSDRAPEGPFRAPGDNRKAVEKALSRATMGLAIGIVALASILFFVIPRYRTGYLTALGMEAQNITGFSGTVNLGDIKKILQSNIVVMRVVPDGDPREYRALKWRGVGLTSFDGKQWYNDNTAQRAIPEASFQRFVVPHAEGWNTRRARPLRYKVLLTPVSTDVVFVASVPREVTGRMRMLNHDQTDSLHSPGHSFMPFSYEVLSDTGAPTPAELRGAPSEYSSDIQRIYLQLPELDPRIAALAKEVTAPAATPYEKAVAVEQYLRNRLTYSLNPSGIMPDNPIGSFLFEAKSGYCEYFAAAMTVMLRSQGVPARIVNGFQAGTYNRVGKDFIVRGRDAHSWVEVYFPSFGWITFDPTPADPNPVVPGPLDEYIDAASLFWNEWIINYDFRHQVQLARTVERDSREMQQDFAQRIKRIRQACIAWAYRTESWLMRHKALVFLFMLAVLAALILAEKGDRIAEWRFALVWRFRRKDRALSPAEATLTYNLFLKKLSKRGFSKSAAQTPREFALSFAGTALAWPVAEFTRLYNALRFGQAGISLAKLRELLGEITAVKK
jgi:protein-glutamine gamma-glutamyltransferase